MLFLHGASEDENFASARGGEGETSTGRAHLGNALQQSAKSPDFDPQASTVRFIDVSGSERAGEQ